MGVRFGICPHDTRKDLSRWKALSKALEKELAEEVELLTFADFDEEDRRILKEGFDLYYASPDTALRLHREGYSPLGRISGESDFVYLIRSSKAKKEGVVRLAVADLHYLYSGLELLKNSEMDNIVLLHTRSHEETYVLVKEGRADYGLFYSLSPPQVEGVEVLEGMNLGTFHLFMARGEKTEQLREALAKRVEGFEPVVEEAIEGILRIRGEIERIITRWEEHDIAKAVLEAPSVGVLIYQEERIVYANDYACEVLGCSRDELYAMPFYNFVSEVFRNQIKAIAERRLKGGERVYAEFKIQRKDKRQRWVLAFAKTIVYRGKFSGFTILIDITKRKRLEALHNLLREVNQVITTFLHEEELLEKVCTSLVEKAELRFVWIGRVEEEYVKPFIHCGYEEGYLKWLRISLSLDLPEGKGLTAIAVREGKIVINPDTERNPSMGPWREEMMRRGYLSSCAVPLHVGGKIRFVLNLYASEPDFFEEENREALDELKGDLEFALNRFQELIKSIVMSRALESSHSWVLITNREGKILYVNDTVLKISGYSREELLGKKPSIFKSGIHSKQFYEELWKTILSGNEFRAVFVNRAKDGSLFHIEQVMMPVGFPSGEFRFVSVGRDITEEIRMKGEIEILRFYDPLTGLLNLPGFSLKVVEMLKKAKGYGALIILDVHNMAYINGAFGFGMGDKLLRAIAKRLAEYFREYDVIARIGGDEFGIFAFPIKRKEDVLSLSEKLREIFREPFSVNGKGFTLGINVGISLFPEDGKSYSELHDRSFLALRSAKEKGAGEIEFFNRELEEKARGFVRAESLLERALKKGLFLFYFQPYYRLSDMKLSGAELLIRIRDEEGNVHGPAEFIDYLEKSRFLRYFEEWSIEEIERLVVKFSIPFSFNVSARSFFNDDYIDRIYTLSLKYKRIHVFELTERILIVDVERTKNILRRLHNNLRIAIDDFGTGYSSLAYIKDLPVDIIKVDISFIRSMVEDRKNRALVESIVQFASRLGLESHAEGLEGEEQLQLLNKMGCTYAQGFFFAKPMPEEELERLLEG